MSGQKYCSPLDRRRRALDHSHARGRNGSRWLNGALKTWQDVGFNWLPRQPPGTRPTEPLVSFRSYRQLSGKNFSPLMIRAFRAHCPLTRLSHRRRATLPVGITAPQSSRRGNRRAHASALLATRGAVVGRVVLHCGWVWTLLQIALPIAGSISQIRLSRAVVAAVASYLAADRNRPATAPIRLWVAGLRMTGALGHCRNALYMRPL
jgi:hypothetical protein